MTFDPTKPVQTRDGRLAKILATGVLERIPDTYGSRLPGQTILASVDGEARYFSPCGAYSPGTSSGWDLVNVPEKAEPSGQSEHTPGPWTAEASSANFTITAPDPNDGSPWEVAFVFSDCGAEGTDTPANARLIAAAPELLKAVEELESFVAVMLGCGPDATIPETVSCQLGAPIKIGAIMRDAEAALAKARGEA